MKNRRWPSLRRLLILALAASLPLTVMTAVPGAASAASCNTVATGNWSNNCLVGPGDASNLVEAVQAVLYWYSILRNYPTCNPMSYDGVFGTNTKDATECFQSHTGLSVDGEVGSQTWGKMQSFLEPNGACQGNWCYFNFNGLTNSAIWRQWTPNGIGGVWYVQGVNVNWAQMNTGGPD